MTTRANDDAVRAAYGFDKDLPEEEIVARGACAPYGVPVPRKRPAGG